MKTVYKYPLSGGITTINLPSDAKFCKFGKQGDQLFVWFELFTEKEKTPRELIIHGTGHLIAKDAKWLETILDGGFVWHLYET